MGNHQILKDGTAYSVCGGNALKDGTKYQIWGGRTLVNGTAHEINFAGGLTWVLENPASGNFSVDIGFTGEKSGERFLGISVGTTSKGPYIYYKRTDGSNMTVFANRMWYPNGIIEKDNVITFDEQPAGDLLTWLRASGTQQ